MKGDLSWITKFKNYGTRTIVDFDDYWRLPMSHGLYNEYYFKMEQVGERKKPRLKNGKPVRKKYSTTQFFIDMMKKADYVTCTTKLLANKIRPFNKNVIVLENSINPTEPQWRIQTKPYEKVRIGWIGGAMHWPDIQLLRGTPNKMANDLSIKGRFEFRLFGYKRGSIFVNFANIFTDYTKYKDNCRLFPVRPALQETEDRPAYTQYYNDLDIALVPLVGDEFNSLKSELKIVEAGFFKKPAVVSNVNPYKGIINSDNSMIIKHKTDWYKKLKKLIREPQLRKDIGSQLYEDIRIRYDLRNVNKKREQFYKSIL